MRTIKTGVRLADSNQLSGLKLKIPPPITMCVFAGMMWLVDEYFPLAVWLDMPWNKLGLGIVVLSFSLAIGAFRLFTHFETTPDPRHPEKATSLVTDGVYRLSRNPMYLSLLILLIGWSIYLGSLGATMLPPLFVWVITTLQIKPEEQALEKVFGQEYLEYKQRVRRWL